VTRSRHPETEAFVSLQRAADALLRGVEELLKPAGLTPGQYNVLRILRGAGPQGLPCREIGTRMITRDPDITRLVDRLVTRGLATRTRDTADRRVVKVRISTRGLSLLQKLDAPIRALHRRQMQRLSASQRRALLRLLERLLPGGA